jgi:hypothetical protein
MNLDELQIKISIELDDLNKQLKTVTKGIDKALGPKATKKLMADNNKIVKSGLTSINKTTLNLVKKSRKDTTKEIEAMSKDITKTLNKAFDVSFTKLNSNITSAMNQAKMTVRSACNDIRRELNAALNINGNIRVTSKTSITGSATGSSGSNAASSISSGQYIGAMIIKATNAVIANNNANTTRLEHAIDNLGNKLTSAIKGMNINTNNDDVVKAINNLGKILGKKGGNRVKPRKPQQQEQEGNLPAVIPQETKVKPKKKIQIGTKSNGRTTKYSRVDSGIFFTLEQLNHKVNFILGEVTDTGAFLKALQEALKQSVKATNRYHRFMDDISKSINIKRLGTGSYGSNQLSGSPINFTQGGTSPLDTSQIEAMKKAFEYMQNIRKQSRIPRLNEPAEDYDASEFMAKELHRQVASLMNMAQELNEAFHQTPMGIDEAVQQANFLEEALNAVLEGSKDLTSLSPQIAKGFEFARDVLNQMTPGIRALANEIRNFTKPQAPAGLPALEWQEISPSKRPQAPASIIDDVEWRDIDDIDSSKLNDIKAQLQEIGEEFEDIKGEMLSLGLNDQYLEETLSSLEDWIEPLEEALGRLNEIDNKRIALNIDTTDAKNQIEALRTLYESTIEALRTVNKENALIDLFGNLDDSKKDTNTSNKGRQYPAKPNLKRRDSDKPSKPGKPPKPTIMGFGFGAYKNEIDALIEYAKKAGIRIKEALFNSNSQNLGFAPYQNELHELGQLAKKVGAGIKKALKGAFNINVGPKKLDRALTVLEYSASSVANKIKTKMGSVGTYLKAIGKVMTEPMRKSIRKMGQEFNYVPRLAKLGMNRTSALVKSYSSVIRTHLNKAFTGIKTSKIYKIYTNVSKALNKVKGTVSKFSGKVRETLNKAFTGIKTSKVYSTISKGLSKAKTALNKFANNCKTIWGKIKQIFSKGANDASKATGKLTSGLKGLLTQVFGFFSIYSLINLGREAITQSQTLAQAEIKLTSLMKQRMGATNDTVTAIRQLVEEQSKLGVVSKTALTRGAEQLSMYVHSAKALKDLMPAIANLTAKRGGFMATEDDAEEIATQLGEAIREGTTTPLEQSGIYLSEAEIKKFAALRTEEERAAYLANVIAKNVGNINQALANTPIGAMTQLKNNFKELLGTLGIFLANVLKPIVQWLNVIVVACNNALKALGKLLGFDMTGGALSVGDIGAGGSTEVDTGGIDDAKDSLDDTADSAEDAEKAVEKFKGSLMGFDEINVLSDNTNKNKDDFDPTDITPGEGGQLIPDVGELTEGEGPFDKFADKMKAFMDEVLEPFKNAWALLGDRWKAEWADLIDSFKHFCDSLATFLKSVWEHGKRFSAVYKPRKIGRTLIIIKTHILDTKEMISCKKYGKISKDMKDFIKYLIWVK